MTTPRPPLPRPEVDPCACGHGESAHWTYGRRCLVAGCRDHCTEGAPPSSSPSPTPTQTAPSAAGPGSSPTPAGGPAPAVPNGSNAPASGGPDPHPFTPDNTAAVVCVHGLRYDGKAWRFCGRTAEDAVHGDSAAPVTDAHTAAIRANLAAWHTDAAWTRETIARLCDALDVARTETAEQDARAEMWRREANDLVSERGDAMRVLREQRDAARDLAASLEADCAGNVADIRELQTKLTDAQARVAPVFDRDRLNADCQAIGDQLDRLKATAYRKALADAATCHVRAAGKWAAEPITHPGRTLNLYAYTEGARVLTAWADDPTRMDGPLRGAGRARGDA